MLDGVHSNATKIIFGSDLWPYFIDEVASHGNRLLMIFGSVSNRQQLLQSRLESDLNSRGIKTFCLCGVEADPDANKVYEAIKLIRHQNIDSVLAVGGVVLLTPPKQWVSEHRLTMIFLIFSMASQSPRPHYQLVFCSQFLEQAANPATAAL